MEKNKLPVAILIAAIAVVSICLITKQLAPLSQRIMSPTPSRSLPTRFAETSTLTGSTSDILASSGPPLLSLPASTSPTPSGTMPLLNHRSSPLPPDWKTLAVETYKLQFSYPTNGWDLMDVKNSTSSPPHQPLYVAKFYSDRTGQDDDAYLVVAVYGKTPSSSLTQWVSEVVPNLDEIPEGDIYQALAKAYAKGKEIYTRASTPGYSPPPDELVTHEEGEGNGTMTAELGSMVSGGGRLAYITWLTRNGSNYVYAVELRLGYAEYETTAPTDQQIIDVYKQLISSVVFTD